MNKDPNFLTTTHQGRIIVKRSNREDCFISMVPAEVDRATNIVGTAISSASFPNLPDHIRNSPFVVRIFKGNDALALERIDQKGSLPFRLLEADELIQVLQTGLGIALNEQAQGKAIPMTNQFVSDLVSDEPL